MRPPRRQTEIPGSSNPRKPARRQAEAAGADGSSRLGRDDELSGRRGANEPLPSFPAGGEAARGAAASMQSMRRGALMHPEHLQVQGASSVFAELKCFQGMSASVLFRLAHVAQRRRLPAGTGSVIMAENTLDLNNDFLWVIEHGIVLISEAGEELGSLEDGAMFGEVVVLGHAEQQPFTARHVGSVPLTAWCIPHAAVCSALKQNPSMRQLLEERMEQQVRRLLLGRMASMAFFTHCSPHFFQPLQKRMTVEYFKRDMDLFAEDEHADSMVVVVRGSCQLTSTSTQKRRCNVLKQQRTPGVRPNFCGEEASRGIRQTAVTFALPRDSEDAEPGLLCASPSTGDGSSPHELPPQTLPVEASQEGTDGDEAEVDAQLQEENEEEESLSSGESDDSKEVTEFALPESKVCLEPAFGRARASAGPGALAFGDGVLLGFQHGRPCTAVAISDCIAFVLRKGEFLDTLQWHPFERRRYEQMSQAHYQEWHHCGLSRISAIDMFRNCSPAFLSALAEVAQPRLFFAGEDVVAEGSELEGLMLLMSGTVEQVASNASAPRLLSAPHSFGPLQFLGASSLPCDPLRATNLCRVLQLGRQEILGCLKVFPDESTAMVTQVLRHNGRRMSLLRQNEGGSTSHGSWAGRPRRAQDRRSVLRLNLWHLPFCQGLDPSFVEELTVRLEIGKLVPGQQVFRKGADSEFLVVLMKGRVCVNSVLAPPTELQAPFLISGPNRNTNVDVQAVDLCAMHRLSISACAALAEAFPRDMRRLLDRIMSFQARLDAKLGRPWWTPYAALRHLSVFSESHHAFLERVAEQLNREIYLPGENLVVEGARVDSTMIIESGEADVLKIDTRVSSTVSNKVAEIKDGFWIGGVGGICGFAGELRRNATICATKVCKVHRIVNSVFIEILSNCPHERQRFRQLAERQLQTQGEMENLEDHSFFKGLSRDLLNLLRPKCRPQVFFADEALMQQSEPAESLFILGVDSIVTMEVDGKMVREHMGRACLGVVALLSKWPVRRASTVVTKIACSVRTLTRTDWLEALKHHPEHRRWIDTFTSEQLERVSEARGELHRRKAWDKIQVREAHASQQHRERLMFWTGGSRTMPLSARSRCGPRQGLATPSLPPATLCAAECVLEHWDCFNGKQVTMPHTRLPRLAVSPHGGGGATSGAELEEDAVDQESTVPSGQGLQQRRTLALWAACEQALGVEETEKWKEEEGQDVGEEELEMSTGGS